MRLASTFEKQLKNDKHSLAGEKFKTQLYRLVTNRIAQHAAFWVIILLLLTIAEGTRKGFLVTLSNELINVFFYAAIIYFNLFYLIPNYLTKKRFFTYAALLILSAIIITPLKVLVLYFKLSSMPLAQNELLRNLNWYFLVTFLIAGLSTIIKIISDWTRQLRERQALETQTMQSELRFLKSQVNPHFLFNTLNNLYALTLKKDEKAPEIVIKLSEMMRYMLYECNEKRVPLQKEVNYIKNYLELEKLRQGKNVDINFELKGQIRDQQIAPLLFITFLENSFKHGLSNQIDQGFVNIHLEAYDDWVRFYIENSKPEAAPAQVHKRSGGIGLVNVHRRLNLLYPDRHELKIYDNPNTYAVDLKLYLEN